MHLLGKAADAAEAAGDAATLRKWVVAMEEIVHTEYQDDVPSEQVLASILPLLCQDGRVLQAVRLLRRSVADAKETRLRAFVPVLSALSRAGHVDLFVEVRGPVGGGWKRVRSLSQVVSRSAAKVPLRAHTGPRRCPLCAQQRCGTMCAFSG